MDFTELKKKSPAELDELLATTQIQVRELRFRAGADQLKDVRELREAKKTVAKLLTLKRQLKQE